MITVHKSDFNKNELLNKANKQITTVISAVPNKNASNFLKDRMIKDKEKEKEWTINKSKNDNEKDKDKIKTKENYKNGFTINKEQEHIQQYGLALIDSFQWKLFKKYLMETNK